MGNFSMGFPTGVGGTDVFLNLGSHMPDVTILTGMPKGATLINAQVEYDKIANIYPTEVAIAAGTKETIRALIDSIEGMATSSRIEAIRSERMPRSQELFARNAARRTKRAEKTWNDSRAPPSDDCIDQKRPAFAGYGHRAF